MKKITILMVLIFLMMGCSSDPTENSNVNDSNFATEKNHLWRYRLTDEQLQLRFSRDMDAIYVGSSNGDIIAADPISLNKLWSQKMPQYNEMSNSINAIAMDEKALYVSSAYSLNSIDKQTGKLLWQIDIGNWVNAAPLVYEGKVVIGDDGGRIVAYNATTGDEEWSITTKQGVRSEAVERDGIVFMYGNDGLMYAIDGQNGEIKWKTSTRLSAVDWDDPDQQIGEMLLTRPVFYNNLIIFGSWDGYVYGLDVESGKMSWETNTGKKIHTFPLILNDLVYISNLEYSLALNATSGEIIWKNSVAEYTKDWHATDFVSMNGRLYNGVGKNIVVRDQLSGDTIDQWATPHEVDSVYIHQGILYYCLVNGEVLAKEVSSNGQSSSEISSTSNLESTNVHDSLASDKLFEDALWEEIDSALENGEYGFIASEIDKIQNPSHDMIAIYNLAQYHNYGQDGDEVKSKEYLYKIPSNYKGKYADLILYWKTEYESPDNIAPSTFEK